MSVGSEGDSSWAVAGWCTPTSFPHVVTPGRTGAGLLTESKNFPGATALNADSRVACGGIPYRCALLFRASVLTRGAEEG
jgi:hypothetical protein